MRKRHLKLVVSNTTQQETIFKKFWEFVKPRLYSTPFLTTQIEKKQVIQNYLTVKYADYQATTGIVGLFPLNEAINAVNTLEREGKINAYYRIVKKRMAKQGA